MDSHSAAAVSTTWFVIPIYFDSESFLQVHERVVARYGTTETQPLRFVVIDDSAGEDPAVDQLRSMPGISVVTPLWNLGHQRALVFGLRVMLQELSADDVIVTMDGDGEDRPEDVERLLRPLLDDPTPRVILARRTHRATSIQFKVMYFFFQLLFRTLTGTVIKTGNFACYRASVLKRIIGHPSFDRCYSSSLIALRVKKVFVPCSRGARYAGRSRMSTLDLAVHGFRMLMPFIDRIAVRFLMAVGVLMTSAVGAIAALSIARFGFAVTLPGWAFFSAFGVLVVSVLLFVNFIVLFTVFSQSHSISLQGIEERLRSTRL